MNLKGWSILRKTLLRKLKYQISFQVSHHPLLFFFFFLFQVLVLSCTLTLTTTTITTTTESNEPNVLKARGFIDCSEVLDVRTHPKSRQRFTIQTTARKKKRGGGGRKKKRRGR